VLRITHAGGHHVPSDEKKGREKDEVAAYIQPDYSSSPFPPSPSQSTTVAVCRYFLESDSITGPWTIANYMSEFGPEAYFVNHPSKFLAAKANTTASPPTYDAFLMYSANFAFHNGAEPPNSGCRDFAVGSSLSALLGGVRA